MQYSTYDETEWTNCTDTNMSVTAFDSWDGSTEKVVKFHIPSDEDNYASEELLSAPLLVRQFLI